MVENKKCKGTGKAKGFGCGAMVIAKTRKYGLGIKCGCFSTWLLNTEEGKALLERTTLKVTRQRRELEIAKKEYDERKSLPYLLTNTTNSVHRYIKERDKGKPCISCGRPYHNDFQAGHYFKAESYSMLKFSFVNIHGQCPQCNLFMDGNNNGYSLSLPKRIGKEAFKTLCDIASQSKSVDFKWDREELLMIRHNANVLYKKLLDERMD